MSDRLKSARRGTKWMIAAVGGAMLIAILMYVRSDAGSSGGSGGAVEEEDPPTIVDIGVSRREDVPIELTAVGTVEPENSVLVRSRVDGRITAVRFVEGQQVAAGQVLFEIDPRPLRAELARARATLATASERLDNARRDLRRLASLAERKLVSMQALDAARSQVEQLEAAASADRAEVDRFRLQADEAIVRAPLSGRTGERLVDAGNVIRADDEHGLVRIVQINPVQVAFSLPGEAVAPVRRAQRDQVALQVTVHDRTNGKALAEGELILIDNMVDSATGTVKLKARFRNEDEALWPNDFVQVRLRTGVRRDAVVVQASAVQDGPEGRFVFKVDSEDKVAIQPVEVESCMRELCILTGGLEAGVRVVTDGQHKLDAGMRVAAPKPAAKNGKEAGA